MMYDRVCFFNNSAKVILPIVCWQRSVPSICLGKTALKNVCENLSCISATRMRRAREANQVVLTSLSKKISTTDAVITNSCYQIYVCVCIVFLFCTPLVSDDLSKIKVQLVLSSNFRKATAVTKMNETCFDLIWYISTVNFSAYACGGNSAGSMAVLGGAVQKPIAPHSTW